MNRLVNVIIMVICFVSCHNYSSRLRSALKESGTNRAELEKVLDYFSKPEDRLKLKAAVFLIENMPGHYSLCGTELDVYKRQVDSVYSQELLNVRRMRQAIPFRIPGLADSLTVKEDVKTLTSSFLIGHIEQMFRVWAQNVWLQELNFDDFCAYLLPYRISYEEPGVLDRKKDSAFQSLEEDLLHYDNLKSNPYELGNSFRSKWLVGAIHIHHINYNHQDINYTTTCSDYAIAELWQYRLLNIPAALDFVPHFPNRNGRHCWSSVINGQYMNGCISDFSNRRLGKVYRQTYAHNPIPHPDRSEIVPDLFQHPFNKDVTDLYMNTVGVRIELANDIPKTQYAYLSVFNDLVWQVVAYGEVKRRKVYFPKMGCDVVYLPLVCTETQVKPAGYPFVLKPTGEIQAFLPDRSRLQTVCLTRKYPLTNKLSRYDEDLSGACIVGSDSPLFMPSDTVCCIREKNYQRMKTIFIDSPKTYRYWRLSRSREVVYLAELQFCDTSGIPLSGEIVHSNACWNEQNVFDNDPLSYGSIRDWVGMDFGKPVGVHEVRYLSRNDANGICPGDMYELFYHDLSGWVSLGRQKAADYSLKYENVPAGALLWLRDLTRGVEERIFSYQNGEIRFW